MCLKMLPAKFLLKLLQVPVIWYSMINPSAGSTPRSTWPQPWTAFILYVQINPSCAKLFWGKICYHFLSFLHNSMTQVVKFLPHVKHGPGHARSQGINNQDVYYIEPVSFSLRMLRVNNLRNPVTGFKFLGSGWNKIPVKQVDCRISIL